MKAVTTLVTAIGMAIWANASLAEPAGDARVTLARIHYSGGGDWYGNETSWSNLLTGLAQRTTINCAKKESTVTLRSNSIFYYPICVLSGHGNVSISEDEADRLRQYLTGGGFLWVDDDYGMDESIRPMLKKVLPGVELVELPVDHPIYHTVYDLKEGLPKIHLHSGGAPRGYGMFYQGRLVVFYSFNTDIGDGLEDPDVHGDPPAKREAAMQMGINIVVYALQH